MDATEVRVRRPVEGQAGRDMFVSGKARLNTMKALVICDPAGRLLFCGATRPGSMHDLTQARTAGLVDLLLHAPLGVQVLADAHHGQVVHHSGGRNRTSPWEQDGCRSGDQCWRRAVWEEVSALVAGRGAGQG
ncbi:transposase family protein [Micromonospora sp. DT178]|uniref:transposase family protein n=1 Tax=Micromonospora sp. DT178 TaxID=3393436 RepID=UPI003CFA8323